MVIAPQMYCIIFEKECIFASKRVISLYLFARSRDGKKASDSVYVEMKG
jgi:hypothetical protein